MEYQLLSIIGILLLIICALLFRIRLLHQSIQEISAAFQDILATDTNTLINISSRDPYLLKLAADINIQLRRLRVDRHRFLQGDRELKEAVTNLSHDLRTPLAAIRGYLDLLDREEKSEPVLRYLSHIRNRTEAMSNLTEELFRYSVVTSVETLKPEWTDLVRLLEESLVSFYGAMTERDIAPEISLPKEPIRKNLDQGAVSRIFSNIISNALKYSDGDFSVSMDEDGTILFTNSASGMNPVTAGRLFDRFFTVEAGRNSTGLGLAIAKVLTERMGGTIEASYSKGKLCIKLSFPGGC